MQALSLNAVPSQTINAVLGGQNCTLNIYTLSTGLFMDILINGSAILSGAICLNQDRIIRDAYLGFVGDLAFTDTQGASDPVYTGLGSRYVLLYLEETDL